MIVQKPIYLDANATCPLRPAVVEVMQDFLHRTQGIIGNASSIHQPGRQAFHKLRQARQIIAMAVGSHPQDIIFTSGATESNNLFLQGFCRSQAKSRLIVGAGDHTSILQTADYLASTGVIVHKINLLENGLCDQDHLESILTNPAETSLPTCLSILHANNETGIIQPLSEIVDLAQNHQAWVHLDAVQSLGKIPVNMTLSKVDAISISGHKLGGPQGVGALIVRDTAPFSPLFHGGRQEKGKRAGTENVLGIIGFAKAVESAMKERSLMAQIGQWRHWIETQIAAICPQAQFFGQGTDRLPTTSSIMMPGIEAETQLMAFDLDHIAISSGSACSSGKVGPSHVLQAMGISSQQARHTIRLSLGWHNSFEDCDTFVKAWQRLYQRTNPMITANSNIPAQGHEAIL